MKVLPLCDTSGHDMEIVAETDFEAEWLKCHFKVWRGVDGFVDDTTVGGVRLKVKSAWWDCTRALAEAHTQPTTAPCGTGQKPQIAEASTSA